MVSVSMQQVGMQIKKAKMETACLKGVAFYVCCHFEIQFVCGEYCLVWTNACRGRHVNLDFQRHTRERETKQAEQKIAFLSDA